MKDTLLESAGIVIAVLVVATSAAVSYTATKLDSIRCDELKAVAVDRVTKLVRDMNRIPPFFDLPMVEKWRNIKPEYDAILDGIAHGVDPKTVRSIRAHVRVNTEKLLDTGEKL